MSDLIRQIIEAALSKASGDQVDPSPAEEPEGAEEPTSGSSEGQEDPEPREIKVGDKVTYPFSDPKGQEYIVRAWTEIGKVRIRPIENVDSDGDLRVWPVGLLLVDERGKEDLEAAVLHLADKIRQDTAELLVEHAIGAGGSGSLWSSYVVGGLLSKFSSSVETQIRNLVVFEGPGAEEEAEPEPEPEVERFSLELPPVLGRIIKEHHDLVQATINLLGGRNR